MGNAEDWPTLSSTQAKYRASCDRCQDLKLRCSQEKPVCRRCAQKGSSCVYSPLRRLGRPRKAMLPKDDGTGERSPRDQHAPGPTTPSHVSNQHHIGAELVSRLDRGTDPLSAEVSMYDVATIDRLTPVRYCSTGAAPSNEWLPSAANTLDCHVRILERTIRLEKDLLAAPSSPAIDLILEAERDLHILQQKVLGCRGHGTNSKSCLRGARPVLLNLMLFAERIVGLMEDVFRLAAENASASTSNLVLGDDLGLAGSTKRIGRCFRGLLNQPCVFPVPTEGTIVRNGAFALEGMAKGRAVKRILQLRLRKLQALLKTAGEEISQRRDRSQAPCGAMDWGDSAAMLEDTAYLFTEDLERRIEALHGGMVLMG